MSPDAAAVPVVVASPGAVPPVTVVSVSMDISTLQSIDRAALNAGRTRSAFVRWAIRKVLHDMDADAPRRRQSLRRRMARAGIGEPYPATDRMADLFQDADPTRGGTWNPDTAGDVIICAACDSKIASGFLYCPICGVEQEGAV